MNLNVAIVGCGLVGHKRALALQQQQTDRLVLVVDIVEYRARTFAQEFGCRWATDWREAAHDPTIDTVVICTINQLLKPISIAALASGKHVLCEKPLGRNADEARAMVVAQKAAQRVLKTGFNHRHHPAILRAHQMVQANQLGPLMFIRCIYGHGGRSGYESEWRGDKEKAGGGEMLDQGVHVLDLCRWFLGDFSHVVAWTRRFFWNIGPLEDNAFVLLETGDGKIASIHTSWTQWRNRFSFEIFGEQGYIQIEGLGGNYGVEGLTVGERRPEFGPPVEERFSFEGGDESWLEEWKEFKAAICEARAPLGSGEDGLAVAELVEAIYASSRAGGIPITINGRHECIRAAF